MVGTHDLTERLEWYVIYDTTYLSYVYSNNHILQHLKTQNFKVHIYKLHKVTQKSRR